MKTNRIIVIVALGVAFFSCSSPEIKPETKTSEKIVEITQDEELSKEDRRRKRKEENRLDSLRLASVLNQALAKIESNAFSSSFEESFQAFPDSLYHVNVRISYDYHFSNRVKHLIVHRMSPVSNQIDVFYRGNESFKKILSHDEHSQAYTGDTLIDVNRDGQKDLVVNWYGLSGCCLKAHAEVYLMRPDLLTFSDARHFINPTFSPKERVVRGVCYGHPGETELYKYKWSGENIDTIEYVAFERDDTGERTGSIIISNQYPSHKDYTMIRKVMGIPKEYRTIEGYSWFTTEFKRP